MSSIKPLTAKVVLVGATGVGKTSVLLRHNGQPFTHVSPTIGASFCKSEISVFSEINETKIQLQIWDTAGQEKFRAMAPLYYRNAEGALAVYDISSLESFQELKSWIEELFTKVATSMVVCVIGNKADLHNERQVSSKVGQTYADLIGASFFETSALTNRGIEEAFHNLAVKIFQEKLQSDSAASDATTVSTEEASQSKSGCC